MMAGNQKMVIGNQDLTTKTVKDNPDLLTAKKKMATGSALTTKMATGSALTTKMVAGDLGLMMVIKGRTKTAKENPDLLTAKKKRVAGNQSQTTKMATENALTTKMATESALTTKMAAGDLGPMMVIRGRTKTAKENPDLLTAKTKRVAGNPSQTTKMVTESALTTKMNA